MGGLDDLQWSVPFLNSNIRFVLKYKPFRSFLGAGHPCTTPTVGSGLKATIESLESNNKSYSRHWLGKWDLKEVSTIVQN